MARLTKRVADAKRVVDAKRVADAKQWWTRTEAGRTAAVDGWSDGSQAARGWTWDETSHTTRTEALRPDFEAASGALAAVRIDRGNLSL